MIASERRSQLLALAAAFALACVSTPESVERTRESLRDARADPAVAKGAPIELDQARKAVARLEQAANDDASEVELEHLAYIAEQKIQIARVAATEEEIRQEVNELTEKREALRQRASGAKAGQAKARARAEEAAKEPIEIRSERVE